jgi:hypothetical protein
VFFLLENASKYFFLKKLIFNISTSKQFKNKKNQFKTKKKSKSFKNMVAPQCQTMLNFETQLNKELKS